jgi:hypothetical protein
VQDCTGDEPISELGVQPFEVPYLFAGRSGGGSVLDGEDVAGGDFGDQVDLVRPIRTTDMDRWLLPLSTNSTPWRITAPLRRGRGR